MKRALLLALVVACGAPEVPGVVGASDDLSTETFTNPVLARDCPDPGVLATEEDGAPAYYMVCTGGGFEIRRSRDLVRWRTTGAFVLKAGEAPWADNGDRNWAPEIHQIGSDDFVAYFTAADRDDRLAIGVAHAASPTGPWIADPEPLVRHSIGVIDATYFRDHDGRGYLYWKVDGNQEGEPTPILVRELADDGRHFREGSRARTVLTNDLDWEGPVVEAPWVVEREGTYFLFYAANAYDARYLTGVARAPSPLGPFEKLEEPILENNDAWLGAGHGSVVHVSGADWFVHHAWNADDLEAGRFVLLDRITWRDGWPAFAGASSAMGPQPRP